MKTSDDSSKNSATPYADILKTNEWLYKERAKLNDEIKKLKQENVDIRQENHKLKEKIHHLEQLLNIHGTIG
jgi:cell division protein FtsB